MNHQVHHFDMGLWLLFLAYVVSVTGSVVGLACTRCGARATNGRDRLRWLVMASVAIGGVGIWLMHFIAMLGFTIPNSTVRYHLGWTIASAVIAIVAVFVGLITIGREFELRRLLAGGVITGLAVAVMHYTGMWAVQMQGTMTYDTTLVVLSFVIAVVAATAALWFTLVLESRGLRFVAGLVMGVAVTGMHYTGMAAVRVNVDHTMPVPSGPEVFSFLFPVFVIGLLALGVPITAVMLAPDPDRSSEQDEAESRPVAAPVGRHR
ncbi:MULTISPECIES: MHYT domain-containing protein [Mycobacterium]|uniref:MHYT domain-containing protein n=1 Tax=Mycobacterium TaxID=1763 RepID=UPI00095DF055|nr:MULTISPECIES: MHYT domain-containing protein [Mycobacterium]OLT85649.1 signal protein [Mycobacterium syngnathidarum]TMS53140.1 signal protein [Mycobacterium sp. DBP42]